MPDWLAYRAASTPERVALVAGGTTWSFAQLDTAATRIAQRLTALGVRKGDRIATLMHNGPGAAALPHAALRLGATVVPLNVRLSDPELAWMLEDAAPQLLLADERTLTRAAEVAGTRPNLITATLDRDVVVPGVRDDASGTEESAPLHLAHDLDAVLAIIYTSGTTGQPKGAMLTVGNFWWSAVGSALNLGTHADDRWLVCLPLFHVGGLSIVLRSAIYGIAAVVHDGFDADAVNAEIDAGGATIVSVVAVMLQRLLDARGDRRFPSTLRCVLLGGGPAPRPLLERCAALRVPVVQTYGLTEACSQVATLAPEDVLRRMGSAGRVLYPNELRIAADGRGGSDRDGEILVRGPIVMAGYAGRPDATADAIVDGWLRTGDVGRLDADGYLYVLDRRDDLIVTGGENVYPAEVEDVILEHPAVDGCAVVGVAHASSGESVKAYVVLAAGQTVDEDSIIAFCTERLARYKCPEKIMFVDELPVGLGGKLLRRALR